MRHIGKVILLSGALAFLFSFYGCALTLKPQFAPLRNLPPEAMKAKNPAEVEVMTGEPPIGKEYIEIGYITVDETKVSPLMTMTISNENIIQMVRKKAAEYGADAVIKFKISGESPARVAKGIAIVYRR